MGYTFEDMREIYDKLSDDISKKLFIARANVSITGDTSFVTDLESKYMNLDSDTIMLKEMLLSQKQRTVIFGAGMNGRALVSCLHNLKIFAFIDNFRKEKIDEKTKLPIYSLEDYKSEFGLQETTFIISVFDKSASFQIEQQLLSKGVLKNDIIRITKDWRNNSSQYFDVFLPKAEEVFVDCGCFNGSSAFGFAAWCGEFSYNKIICFEPDPQLYKKCSSVVSKLNNCYLYEYGLSDKTGQVSFLANGKEDARIVTNNSYGDVQTINTIDLDTFLSGERVTFIKMDIEGAEYDALVGASKIIKEQKPRLAVCLYHNYDHIVSIPKLLLTLRNDYRFIIRHYSMLDNETVLYAY